MKNEITSEANKLKQLAGSELKDYLIEKFSNLVEENIISAFSVNQNFPHQGFLYNKQYLANFIIETLDNKFIIINSSNSYRHDRMKLQAYDVEGVTKNASISDSIIASILLYPDSEIENKSLITFRNNVIKKNAYSPATHILVISELVNFLENHKIVVKEKIEEDKKERSFKGGSYYGLRGNAFEKEIVTELNNDNNFQQFRTKGNTGSTIFNEIMAKVCNDNAIHPSEIINLHASNTVLKLRSGGNAKTDIVIIIKTIKKEIIETISVKNTTQNRVSCHDYKCDDFIRVLQVEGTKLSKYLSLYQESGAHALFQSNMPDEFNVIEFEKLLEPHKDVLLEWALTGKHDNKNLIDPNKQISSYLLINKSGNIRFIDFTSYMSELYLRSKLSYGLPLSWTYPSKQRGVRIQLKLPILM